MHRSWHGRLGVQASAPWDSLRDDCNGAWHLHALARSRILDRSYLRGIRNPMISGVFFVLVGEAVSTGSLPP